MWADHEHVDKTLHGDDQGWYYDHRYAGLSCDGKEHCALDLEYNKMQCIIIYSVYNILLMPMLQ